MATDDETDLSLDKPESIPGSVILAIIALSCMLALNALSLVLILNVPNRTPQALIQPIVSLIIGALVLWGFVAGHRLAWQWGRYLGLLGAILYTLSAVLVVTGAGRQEGPRLLLMVIGGLAAFVAACLWTIFFAMGTKSARFHFRLRCPQCGRYTSQAADFFFNKAKCKRCNITW